MLSNNIFLDESADGVDKYLQQREFTPESKKRFALKDGSYGYIYQLGIFGIEITVHQFIIFSKYNGRYIEMDDYKNADELLEYVLPLVGEFIDDPVITKNIIARQFYNVKKIFSFPPK